MISNIEIGHQLSNCYYVGSLRPVEVDDFSTSLVFNQD